jgi:hypothetical protein
MERGRSHPKQRRSMSAAPEKLARRIAQPARMPFAEKGGVLANAVREKPLQWSDGLQVDFRNQPATRIPSSNTFPNRILFPDRSF